MARPLYDRILQFHLADVSAEGIARAVCPYDGKIIELRSVLHAAITGADANVTVEINGTAVTGAAQVIVQDGSAADDTFVSYPTALNVVKQGDVIEVISDGASSTTAPIDFTMVIRELGAP